MLTFLNQHIMDKENWRGIQKSTPTPALRA
jgi:hypothetical protein